MDWEPDAFDYDDCWPEEDPPDITCKYCGEDDLQWVRTGKGFRLFDPEGRMHLCKKGKQRQGMMETYINIDNGKDEDEKMGTMNMKNAAALIRDDMTTIRVTHENHGGAKVYTYRALRSLADTLEKGDTVLVKNTHGITTAEVESVDQEPEIDVYAGMTCRWAFQKVDVAAVDRLEHEDKLVEDKMAKMQAKSAREQVLAAFGISEGSGIQQFLADLREGKVE